jgi:hypothetical protein
MLRRLFWLAAFVVAAVVASEIAFADRLRFHFQKAAYRSEIGNRDLALFIWSEWGSLGGGLSFKGVVFDRSGEIALPPERRTAGWMAEFLKVCSPSIACGALEDSPDWRSPVIVLGGHFYLLRMYDS